MSQPSKNISAYANDIDFTLRSKQPAGAKIADLLAMHEKASEQDLSIFATALIAALVFKHEAETLA